nr:PAS domain-containing protein [Desulfobacterales bacterium]
MTPKKIIWQIYPSYLLITLIALGFVSGYAIRTFKTLFIEETITELTVRGKLLEKQVIHYFTPVDVLNIDRLCKDVGQFASTRITVLLPNGKVLGDSDNDFSQMDNHLDRPEIKQASTGKIGSSVRYSRTLNQRMMYVAQPIFIKNHVEGILRIAIPLTGIDAELSAFKKKVATTGLIIALIASAICFYISRKISQPIEEMKQGAVLFSEGYLDFRLTPPPTSELASLANAMNLMAEQLHSRIQLIRNQRNEYESVLSSMVEGVIAIDLDEKILKINQSAANIFNINHIPTIGKHLQEIIRNHDLQKIVDQGLESGEPFMSEIELYQDQKKVFRIHVSPLCDIKERIGMLLVWDDITQLRALENMRREFVANVSHELKTPLTAIKGFVETLLIGAIDN